jgi:hypothetical protein
MPLIIMESTLKPQRDIPSYLKNGFYQKDKKQVVVKMWKKENPYTLLVGK